MQYRGWKMETKAICNASIVMSESIIEGQTVVLEGSRIKEIVPDDQAECEVAQKIDAGGCLLAPGYIDLHMHGACSFQPDKNSADLEELTRVLPKYGVTSFLAGILPKKSAEEDYSLLDELSKAESRGTEILGFFLEGHFLSLTGAIPNKAHNKSLAYVNKLKEAARPYKIVFGISPEFPDIYELLPHMTKEGYPAFITHTKANVLQTQEAIRLGAVHATHFYDVFPYPGLAASGVRACGAVEAILADPDVSVDFILDGEHVDPIAVKMALQCKGSEGVSLVTDANPIAGLKPGKYKGFGGKDIVVEYEGGPARLAENTSSPGGLAGSGLTMDRTVKIAVNTLNVPIYQAIKMATYNPAKVLGLHHRKAKIEAGYDADLIMLDEKLDVCMCWVAGRNVYSR